MSVAQSLRELAASSALNVHDAAEISALADRVAEAERVASAAPVGSDLSVFIKNIALLGFVPALKQFILDIFNIK